jgi:hypothetical protein
MIVQRGEEKTSTGPVSARDRCTWPGHRDHWTIPDVRGP